MSSPFSTIEEFNNVLDGPTEGAIYTFANSPVINIIALLVAVGIFIWFMVATYTTHADPSSSMDQSLNHLSTFLVVGLLSVITAAGSYANRSPRAEQPMAQHKSTLSSGYGQAAGKIPLGLLGMVGVGLPSLRRRARRKARQKALSNFLRR
ncbi:MAG: hypothetical protein AAF810_06385 [Cyanobacteria bacterium P01_D01_bin.36]